MVVLALLLLPIASVRAFASSCQLGKMLEFQVTMTNLRPLVNANINDAAVRLLVDSGAFFSILSQASVTELNLSTYPAPRGFYITGIGGGTANAAITKVKTFTLAGVSLHNIEFLVGGSEVGRETVGVLGQNVLHIADVEYDLAQGVIRLMKPVGCGKAVLAYWLDASLPYSAVDIESTTVAKPFTTASAFINGREIRVMFDSGAGVSMLSLKAAARVGIKPDSPGVVDAGPASGFGTNTIPSYIAPFSSFKIGDEEIRNTRLRIADIDLGSVDMLIGPDFFLSHRIYVANSQHKLYFTYNGGPVFNLSGAKYASAAHIAEPAPTNRPAANEPAQDPAPADAQQLAAAGRDAADYSRRAAASASRRDFAQALISSSRACELAPDNPEYLYQRGMIYWQLKQGAAAMADFDQALKLKPDDLGALIARAQLSLQGGDVLRAVVDLDTANAAASKQADIRFEMARDYERADRPTDAIAQYDSWISWHAEDARLPEALSSRCWIRALAGVDLGLALKDCNAAFKRTDKSNPLFAHAANSRGLLLLRLGDYDKSISDYEAALKMNPKNPWSWYGLGIDKLRRQRISEGQADIAQATALWPQIADTFSRHGITP
jgi:tetratricopeptide (TPR) repeat protein